jgi:kynurenine 3-monooxygenase
MLDGTHKLDKNSFHIWPRGGHADCLNNLDGSFTCTLFMPFIEKIHLIPCKLELQSAFLKTTDTIDVIPKLAEDFSRILPVHWLQ